MFFLKTNKVANVQYSEYLCGMIVKYTLYLTNIQIVVSFAISQRNL